jgi:hypothetical protein
MRFFPNIDQNSPNIYRREYKGDAVRTAHE